MLGGLLSLVRRPAPPPPVVATRELLVTPPGYLAEVRARVDRRAEERADAYAELRRISEGRARLAELRRATAAREAVRSGMPVTNKGEVR